MSKTYKAFIEVDTKDAKKSINDLKEEVQDLTGSLEHLDESTDEYSRAQLKAKQSTEQLDLAMEKIQQDGELVGERMGHVARIGAGLAGGFELVAGAMALAGKESEKYEETMRRVAGAMAIGNSLSAMGDAFESLTKIFPAAGIAVESFGKKLKGVLTALKGWPGVLLAAGAAVTAFFIKMRKDTIDAKLELTRSINEVKISLAEETGAVEEMKAVWDSLDLEARKKYYQENREEIDKMTGSQDDFNAAERFFVDHTEAYVDALILRAQAEAKREEIIKGYVEEAKIQAELDEARIKAKIGGGRPKFEASTAAGGIGGVYGDGTIVDPIQEKIKKLEGQLDDIRSLRTNLRQEAVDLETEASGLLSFQEKTKSGGGEEDTLSKSIKQYKRLTAEFKEFASEAFKLSNIPIEGTLLSLINPDEADLENIRRRNDEMKDLADNVSRLQEKSDSINLFNRFKGERKDAEQYLRGLLNGHSDETTKLGNEREALDQKRAVLEEEISLLDAESDTYREHQQEIADINQQIQDNLAETESMMLANRRQGIQEIVDLAHSSADVVSGLMGSLGELFDQGSDEYKAFKIAETVISTLSGSIKAFESLAPIPVVGPALGAAAAASVIASGIATVSQINQVEPGMTPSISSTATDFASTSPTIQSHVTGGEITAHQADNTKVYVLESDIRKTTNKVRVAESEARF